MHRHLHRQSPKHPPHCHNIESAPDNQTELLDSVPAPAASKDFQLKQFGFTLIELMITVAVVAILAAIALPSYTSYIARGKITDGLASLADYRVRMEQYFQDNRNYGAANGNCPVALPTSSYFTFSCTTGSTTPTASYTVTATSVAGALGVAPGDYTYTLNEINAKSTTKFKGASVTTSCWVIRGGEC